MRINFTKMQGCGNDYIYIDCRENREFESLVAGAVTKLSNRHFGVGGDGVILICDSTAADCKMRIFNADGNEAEMCGNGIRCVAKFVGGEVVRVETLAGIKTVTQAGEEYCVCMGIADVIGNGVNMGNPHKVFFTESTDELDIEDLARGLEDYNVEFAEIIGDNRIKMRVRERGSGETLSCGTGACAVAVMAAVRELADGGRPIKIIARGGELTVELKTERGSRLAVYDTYSAGIRLPADIHRAGADTLQRPRQSQGRFSPRSRTAYSVMLIGGAEVTFTGVTDV
jgi:diaminopimelate epimerase